MSKLCSGNPDESVFVAFDEHALVNKQDGETLVTKQESSEEICEIY